MALSGELGAGKTALVKAAAAAFGVKEEVISPTFVYQQQYNIRPAIADIEELTHIDLYRLHDSADVEDLGIELHNSRGVVFLEWPERFPRLLANYRLQLSIMPDGSRTIEVHQ